MSTPDDAARKTAVATEKAETGTASPAVSAGAPAKKAAEIRPLNSYPLLLRPLVWFRRKMEQAKNWTMSFAGRPRALWWLSAFSFIESSFFPIPPDLLLLPIGAAKPKRALRAAALCTLFSVLGGILGWTIGHYGGPAVLKWMVSIHLLSEAAVQTAKEWYKEWGVAVVFVAGMTPIPYKVFTITSGVLNLALLPFIGASIVGRGLRFMAVGLLLRIFGAKVQEEIEKRFDLWLWVFMALLIGGFAAIKYVRGEKPKPEKEALPPAISAPAEPKKLPPRKPQKPSRKPEEISQSINGAGVHIEQSQQDQRLPGGQKRYPKTPQPLRAGLRADNHVQDED